MTTETQTQTNSNDATESDNRAGFCRTADNDNATLPRYARLPINRCRNAMAKAMNPGNNGTQNDPPPERNND